MGRAACDHGRWLRRDAKTRQAVPRYVREDDRRNLGPARKVGKAQLLKLANNLLTATNMVIVGEALAFAERRLRSNPKICLPS